MEFFISKYDANKTVKKQYDEYREKIGILDESSNEFYKKYNIKDELGTGYIEIYKLKDGMEITIYNLNLKEDLRLNYIVDSDYFEIEYCIAGSMNIIQKNKTRFKEGDISISASKHTEGTINYESGELYRGIAIVTDKFGIKNYFGSSGIEVWNKTIEKLDRERRNEYYNGVQVSYNIRNSFLEIFNCKYDLELRKLFFEAKIMEILTNIIMLEKNESILDDYEFKKIKQVPEILMENIFELPTVDQLSKILGINKNKLNDGFKEIYGDSIFSYHRKKSLEKASIYLRTTDKTIQEISLDVGYSTASNFCYAFKKQFGVSPKKYRGF